MKNKIALESMAMDLKRAALGYHNNSLKMAERFHQEALERKREINLMNGDGFWAKVNLHTHTDASPDSSNPLPHVADMYKNKSYNI